MQGCGLLVAVAFSCARLAVVLQVLGYAMRVTVGDAFAFCICALALVAVATVAVAIVVAVFVLHECGDQGGDVCERNCSICRFCVQGKGWSDRFSFRDLEDVEHGCKFSLHDLFDGIRTVESVLLCCGIILTILAGNIEESAEVSP